MNKLLTNQLESLIDQHGLAAVLATIGCLCDDKAEHIQTNWQDAATAQVWSDASTRIQFEAILAEHHGLYK